MRYVLLIEGVPNVFTNCTRLHAAAIIEQQYLLFSKIQELQVENEAERATCIPDEKRD